MTDPRAKRPIANRTHPNRNILGMFGQSAFRAPSDFGHPLGPGFDDTQGAAPTNTFLDNHVMEASDLVDRHIADAAAERAGQDDGWLGSLAGLYAGANGGDLTAVIATLTRTYADVATKWVDLASTVAEGLGQMRSQQSAPPPQMGGLGAAGPVLSIRSAVPVEARVEMFRESIALSAQPLGSDDPANPARITGVRVEDGRLKLRVDADQPPGTYYGLLLEDGAGPAGVVTVEVFESEGP